MTSSVTQQTASRSHHDTAIDLYPQPLYNARDALHVKAPLANQRTDSADYTPTDSPRGAVMSQTFMAEHARFIDGQHDQDTDTEVPAAVPLRVNPTVDIKNHRYPFCLVWGPLPLITWLFPWIGHLGIGDSEGKVHDFAGPYYIGIDSFMTPIHKYYQFPRDQWLGKEAAWNSAIMKSDAEYRKLMHNICCQNCHHHSARALELTHLPDLPTTMFSSWWLITRRGRFISTSAWMCTYMPIICIVAFIIIISVVGSKK